MPGKIKVGNKLIGTACKTFIIAELAGAPMGSVERAKKLISGAKDAGADAVKLQKFSAEELVMKDNKYFDALKKAEFSDAEWKELHAFAKKQGLIFIADLFDNYSLEFLNKLPVDAFKIHTTDINNIPLIEKIAQTRKPIFLAVGAASFHEIEKAIVTIRNHHDKIVLMYGFQSYPTKIEDSNLNRLHLLKEKFGLNVGFLDHTDGSSALAKILPSLSLAKVFEIHYEPIILLNF